MVDRNPEGYEEFDGINGLRLNGGVFDHKRAMTCERYGIPTASAVQWSSSRLEGCPTQWTRRRSG